MTENSKKYVSYIIHISGKMWNAKLWMVKSQA